WLSAPDLEPVRQRSPGLLGNLELHGSAGLLLDHDSATPETHPPRSHPAPSARRRRILSTCLRRSVHWSLLTWSYNQPAGVRNGWKADPSSRPDTSPTKVIVPAPDCSRATPSS